MAEMWLPPMILNMVHTMLGPMLLKTGKDPTGYFATLTRGVPQVAPSSAVYFNIYINDLMESAQRWTGRVAGEEGSMLLVADDVILQATSIQRLQHLLDTETTWAKEKEAT